MSNKTDTWMPLFIGDYLRDTTRLSTEQHGAYLLLIMDYWANGPLPDDDAALAQVTRLQTAAWKKHRPAIARLFKIADGEWRHKRIDEELEKAGQFIAKQKANGSKGGRPKKNPNESQKKPMGFDRDNPNHNPNESPSPSPSQVNPSEQSSPCTQPVDVTTFGYVETEIPDPPTAETHWLNWFNREASTGFDAGSRFDRRDLWPIFRRWCDAGITQRQAIEAIRTAQANAKEPIANLPKYVDRVLANNQSPTIRSSAADQSKLAAARAIFGTEIEGDGNAGAGRIIDISPARPALGS